VILNGTCSDNGTATAMAVDGWGLDSNTVMDLVDQPGS
jgi:hypothetical protein